MVKTYYEKFGLSENATIKEIKKAYRKLVIKYHPDKNNGHAQYEAIIKDINQVYATLSNPGLRSQYDEMLKQQRTASNSFTASMPYEEEQETDMITDFKNFLMNRPWLVTVIILMLLRIANCNSSGSYTSQSDNSFVNNNTPSVGETIWGNQSNPDNSVK